MHSRTDRPETAALIVAAGMSSRMGDFKPMLTIGEMSIAERVITTFQQAGVTRIVVVTGYQAELLERHLAGREVVFLRNERALHRRNGARAAAVGRAARLSRLRGQNGTPDHALRNAD